MEVKFAAAAANFADLNIKIGANAAGARNGGEICRGERQISPTVTCIETPLSIIYLYNILRLWYEVD